MDDFTKYERLRDADIGPRDACLSAKFDGLDNIAQIRMLRKVYRLSLIQAKEVLVISNTDVEDLNEYQKKLLDELTAHEHEFV